MPRPGWTTVSLRNERLEALGRMFEKDSRRPRTQKFGAWLDNFLYEIASYEEELNKYGAFISLENIADNHILLTDNLSGKHIFVNVNAEEQRLECEQDNSSNCIHVGFCFGLPSVYKVLIRRGFRTRRQIEDEETLEVTRNMRKTIEENIVKVDRMSDTLKNIIKSEHDSETNNKDGDTTVIP